MAAGRGGSTTTRRRGFTLVELMIVVAIIGVLAALAIYGVRLYLASAKTSEAKDKVGAMARGATAAYEREATATQTLTEGAESSAASHALCADAVPVPSTFVPQGKQYQPDSTPGADYQSGDETSGWRCLKFGVAQPQYYQYAYTRNGMHAANANPAACVSDCYEASARGDLDGDATVFSYFARTGQVNNTTKALKASTQVYVENERE